MSNTGTVNVEKFWPFKKKTLNTIFTYPRGLLSIESWLRSLTTSAYWLVRERLSGCENSSEQTRQRRRDRVRDTSEDRRKENSRKKKMERERERMQNECILPGFASSLSFSRFIFLHPLTFLGACARVRKLVCTHKTMNFVCCAC